ncbi:MAG TPA: AbrB/MazE/SpoVT family DNA-binding domain-containing protein [Solirubrobacteraceae bacterium]|jgi:AbrB family looped-hinge helix DNA binding protein|nr:AbrB/MazE/SpoVT family DNA-binding domain-containing protein [Solirubrobacteraceae bacterium]
MIATLDASGRIVVPKLLREELGFRAGQRLELSAVDGRLEVEHPVTPMRLERRKGRLVAVVDRPMPELTQDLVREILGRVRR